MRGGRLAGLTAASLAFFAAGAFTPAQGPQTPTVRATAADASKSTPTPERGPQSPEQRAASLAWRRAQGEASHWSYPANTGWTNARYRRAARKARNVKANRRAHRG